LWLVSKRFHARSLRALVKTRAIGMTPLELRIVRYVRAVAQLNDPAPVETHTCRVVASLVLADDVGLACTWPYLQERPVGFDRPQL